MTVRELIALLTRYAAGNLDMPVVVSNSKKFTVDVGVNTVYYTDDYTCPACIVIGASRWDSWKKCTAKAVPHAEDYIGKPKNKMKPRKATEL